MKITVCAVIVATISSFGASAMEFNWSDTIKGLDKTGAVMNKYAEDNDMAAIARKPQGERTTDELNKVHAGMISSFNSTSFQAFILSRLITNPRYASDVVRYRKHAAWYASDSCEDVRDFAANHVVYPCVDTALGVVINKVGQIESVQAVAKKLPEQHCIFMRENGRLVVGAGIVRATVIATKEGAAGMNSKNAQQFGYNVASQVSQNFVDEFVVQPFAKELAGGDETSCEALTIAGNFTAAWLISSFVNSVNKRQ